MSIQNRPNEIFLGKREYFDLLLSKELNEYNELNNNIGRIHQKTLGVLFVVFIVFFGICVMGGLALLFLNDDSKTIFLNMLFLNMCGLFIDVLFILGVIIPKRTERIVSTENDVKDGFLELPIEKLVFQSICQYRFCTDKNMQVCIDKNKSLIKAVKITIINVVFFLIITCFLLSNI